MEKPVDGESGRDADSAPGEAPVFLSYSRKDRWLVAKFELLVAAAGALPWRDETALRPGDSWRIEIVDAVARCARLVVFICRHSRSSQHVRDEYQHALKLGKRVVPVLLDSTPLPVALRHLNAVDLRSIGRLTHLLSRIGSVAIVIGGLVLSVSWVLS